MDVEETASRNELIILAKVLSQSQCALLRPVDINSEEEERSASKIALLRAFSLNEVFIHPT